MGWKDKYLFQIQTRTFYRSTQGAIMSNNPIHPEQQPHLFQPNGRLSRLAWLPIPLCLLAITVLWITNPRVSLPQPLLYGLIQYGSAVLGIIFIVIPAARSFMANGQPSVLMLGCGVLMSQISVGVWPLAPAQSQDIGFAIYNTSVLASAMCHFTGAVITSRRKIRLTHPATWFTVAYFISISLMGLLTWAAFTGRMPGFFIEGQGGTFLRSLIISISVTLFGLTSALLFQANRRTALPFFRWYSLGLILVAVGLAGSMLITLKDSPLQWVTRSTQVLGLVYMCIAILTSMAESSAEGFPLTAVEDAWRDAGFLARLRQQTLSAWLLRYGLAITAVAIGLGFRLALEAWVGPGLPTYITFYPAVIAAAVLAGLGPGLLATALTDLATTYLILTPVRQFKVESSVDRLGLVIFAVMGVLISIMAEFYRRRRDKAAAYDRENALRETRREKEFLANLLEHADQPFAVGYPDGRIGMINQAYEHLTGYTAAELRSRDWSVTLTPPEWREIENQKLQELLCTGQPVRYEKEYIRKDGSRLPIELLVHLMRDPGGKPEYYYSFLTDLTERKQAESALKNTLQRFYTILSGMSSGVLLVTDEGLVEFANQAICDQFDVKDEPDSLVGLTAGVIIEKIRNAFLHPDEAIARIRKILNQGQPVRAEEVAIKGGRTYLRDFTHLNIQGKSYGRLWFHNDITEQKQAEDAIRTSEERFRAAFDGSAVPMSLTAPNGKIIRVNEAFSSMMGYSEDELLSLAFYEFTFPDDMAVNLEGVQKLLDGKLPSFRMEKRYIRKDGQTIWGDMSSAVVRDAAGQPLYMVTHVQDITERKRAEEALREIEELFRLALKNSPVSVAIQDRNLVFQWAYNQRTWRPEEIVGKTDADLFAPEDVARLIELKRRVLESGTEEHVESWLTSNGRRVFLNIFIEPMKNSIGEIAGIGIAAVNLTELKLAEEAFRENEEYLSTVFRASPTGIFVTRLSDGMYLDANETYRKIIGYAEDEVLGHTSLELNIWADVKDRDKVISKLREEGRIENSEIKLRHKNGDTINLIYSALPLERAGEPCILGALTDISTLKQTEDMLRANNEELERLNRAMVGRELRMVELKKEVNELCIKNGFEPTYKLDFGKDQP
jgi:PAS domain S-box-containing protein